jgi:RNA polymerase sigma factor for flagellar operon FliA
VLARYYGQSLTLREAGKSMGVSEARACQLHARAIASLRRALVPAPRMAAAAA